MTTDQRAEIAGLEPVAWRFTKLSVWHVTSERNWAEAHGDCVEPLYTRAELAALRTHGASHD